MRPYLDMLRHILTNGVESKDRTGVGTLSIFGYQNRYNLKNGFPAVTTKKLHMHAVIAELLWFLRGERNIKSLHADNVHIWDEWADETGDLGPVYGFQWRKWPNPNGQPVDQIQVLVDKIKSRPYSRDMVVSAWNPVDVPQMALPPCHTIWQAYVRENTLSLQLYQRSADMFLGVPFNIASYALLTLMLAHVTGCEPGEFIHTFGDAHIYLNHINQVNVQLAREPYPLPQMVLNPDVKDIFAFTLYDFSLQGYKHHPVIKAPIAV